jgi:hypothetical protein
VESEPSGRDERLEGPVGIDLLADLQAGLLDDETAARLRGRAGAEPGIAGRLAALDRIRRDLAEIGTDATSAPDVPADVTARIGTALRSGLPPAKQAAPRPDAHVASGVRLPSFRFRNIAAAAGVAAVVAAGAVGTTTLLRHDGSTASSLMTSRAPGGLPRSDDQIDSLLSRPPDLGDLADPQRRVSCLTGLGYPTSTSVLGARPLAVNGRPGVLVLLPGDTPGRINAVVVAPNCSSVDTGLLASRVVARP